MSETRTQRPGGENAAAIPAFRTALAAAIARIRIYERKALSADQLAGLILAEFDAAAAAALWLEVRDTNWLDRMKRQVDDAVEGTGPWAKDSPDKSYAPEEPDQDETYQPGSGDPGYDEAEQQDREQQRRGDEHEEEADRLPLRDPHRASDRGRHR